MKHRQRNPVARPSSHEQGFALLDAMVGVLLLLIVGLGTAYWLANGYRLQSRSSIKNQIVAQIRQNIDANNGVFGICGTAPVGATTATLPNNASTINITSASGASIAANIALTVTCNVTTQASPLNGAVNITDRSITVTTSDLTNLIGSPGTIQVTL